MISRYGAMALWSYGAMELWSYGAMELRCKLLIRLNLIKLNLINYFCQLISNFCGGYMGLTLPTVT